ncbi:unnamed protein product [Phaedon cochleariae]|uniref:RB1-inducible coiled-coil protein 1 n=1 Tax=Phaedon cochleariae TaxID=80249 RepID=A0A9P0GX09_PHACE|nr:unnamed protein product [Phaedon cochleariae]
MLHVFHVDSGRMMTFDMSLALESVDNLKHFVQEEFKIAAEKQVLLISGGECLDPNKRVCSYSAGTDTNPIFLFSKSIIESPTPPLPGAEHGSDSDIDLRVKEHCDMPVTFTTVSKRAQLAQQLHELARKQLSSCEGLVHDQHLQQQGWSAVVANLEDITVEFRKRSEIFERSFNEYMEERGSYLVFLKHFNNDLEILQRIPVLSALLDTEINTSKTSEDHQQKKEEEEEEQESTASRAKDITLYEWISAADNKSTMDQLYEHCARGLEQFDARAFESLTEDIGEMLRGADNPQMKEVKGLGERLSGLETLMREAKRFVQQQAELAQSFAKHQSRASNTKDSSVLPDLCATHKKQLQMMANNHQQLCDIKRRCTKAKEELSVNLYHRLRWVMYIEDHILEIDQKLVIYHENLKRLRRHLEVLQQIHLAPATYLCAVAEVVRRRAFSQTFLLWASELACHLLTIHNDEVARRRQFQSQFDGHFLTSLFPGMDDLPPSFATQAPPTFDSALPRIAEADVERLKHELPDLADNLNVPDSSAIENFFLIKSMVRKEEEEEEGPVVEEGGEKGVAGDSDRSKDAVVGGGEVVFPVTAHGLPHLKDLDRGCESETDTEEFEKVGQSPLELHFDNKNMPQSPRSRPTQDASTSTEVGEKPSAPPKKPPRTFQKPPNAQPPPTSCDDHCRTMSVSSNTESFTNLKNASLESIDEGSVFDSHHHRCLSKSVSPQSPPLGPPHCPCSPSFLGHQQQQQQLQHAGDFSSEEFFIDESMPSSLSIEAGGGGGGGHNQREFSKQLDTANTVVALLQDNLQISKSEHDRLKTLLTKLHQLAKEATVQLRSELTDLRRQVLSNRSLLGQQCESLGSSWENVIVERDHKEKEALEVLMRSHEVAVEELKREREEKNRQIELLLSEKSLLEGEILRSCQGLNELKEAGEQASRAVEELRRQLQEKDGEREKAVKEASDRLTREHKAELESIRSRFKLMNMDRSPSETNLDRSGDFNSLPGHAALLLQMQDNFELDKERAVSEALVREREKWEKLLEIRAREADLELREVARRVSEEKDLQIDVLRERERNLNLECVKYRSTIQQLAESGAESGDSELARRVDVLEKRRQELEEEMVRLRGVAEGKANTPPTARKDVMSRSDIAPLRPSKISVDSCKPDDLVVVMWDPDYENFKVLQENRHLYFLHSDYVAGLGLEVKEGRPNKLHVIGEVVDKEYCSARKSENRYKVPVNTKFFRVKVKPPPTKDVTQSVYLPRPPGAREEAWRMTRSQSAVAATPLATPTVAAHPALAPPTVSAHPVILERDETDGAGILMEEEEEKHFAEDSGIVDNVFVDSVNVEKVVSAGSSRNESESSDR